MKRSKDYSFLAAHIKIGKIGEEIAAKWLVNKGFQIIERNYRKKWGEIDIVAREMGASTDKVRFVEVKTVSYGTKEKLDLAVSRGTWRPEEMVHQFKLRKLRRAIETWTLENCFMGNIQIDVVTVRLVPREKYGKIKMIENVVIE